MNYDINKLQLFGIGANMALKLMGGRTGHTDLPHYYKDTVQNANEMAKQLKMRGGFPQQERMIKDKRKSLDKATLFSYQACWVKKIQEREDVTSDYSGFTPVRALINPDKNKFDYDDKIISIGFEHGFEVGDVFEWRRTNSYWLITLQDLDELAYFRGEIRRCDYIISWLDEDGNELSTYASIRGPVETKINSIQKHTTSIDEPNHSLHILLPRNQQTMKKFTRYSKFYLKTADNPDDKICWRVEATDSVSTKGILEINAVEYYSNLEKDDIEKGLVDAFVERIKEPELDPKVDIIGPSFIKPKIEYIYTVEVYNSRGTWHLGKTKVPINMETFKTERGTPAIKITWMTNYSGQFDLWFGIDEAHKQFEKTIVVESLF